jgi:hypothetical protein
MDTLIERLEKVTLVALNDSRHVQSEHESGLPDDTVATDMQAERDELVAVIAEVVARLRGAK